MPTPGPIPVQSINHIGRLTRRLEASVAFYRDVLGFRPIERPPFDFPGAWLYNYGVQIHLIVNDAAPDPRPEISTRCDHLALQVADIEQAKRLLQAHGIAYRENYVPGRNVHQVFFQDPDGHHIELACYPPTPRFLQPDGTAMP
jgi:catechol 2,3-dioxygenase-like lactoylglutathione lyase family enzyme